MIDHVELVFALAAATILGARNSSLIALAVLLKASGFLAVAAFLVTNCFGHLGLEGVDVPFESNSNGSFDLIVVIRGVVTIIAIAAIATAPRGEAITVKLETFRIFTVTSLEALVFALPHFSDCRLVANRIEVQTPGRLVWIRRCSMAIRRIGRWRSLKNLRRKYPIRSL